MPLTVGFDATAAARQRAGIGRYTRQLLEALAEADDDTRYRLFYCAGGRMEGALPSLNQRFTLRPLPLSDRVVNLVWQRAHLPLPVQTFIGNFDLFHSPDFTLPPVRGKPTVLTIHDLAFMVTPECAYPTLRAYLTEVVPRSARRASRIIAVSEQTRLDLIERVGISPERITVVSEAAGVEFRPAEDSHAARDVVRRLGIDGPYILSVGTLDPRKNYVRLLEAYAILRGAGVPHRLVIAGAPGWLFDPIFTRLDQLRLRDHVIFLRPDEQGLLALYQSASVCVFPTLYEGFGIPPLEALACGAPVACSSAASLPEVVGDAALLFDPENMEELAHCVQRLLEDAALVTTLRERGLQRATHFSWQRAAAETLEVYGQVVADA